MSIGTTAWLPSTLTCTLQPHYIAHDTTPYCPTIPNHRLNGTVTCGKPGSHPCRHFPLCGKESTPQHRSHIPYLRAAQRPPAISICGAAKWLHPLGGFFINTQPNV